MIHKDIVMVDFEPSRWRNLGEITDMGKKPKRTLYILHDKGVVLNAYDSTQGLIKSIKSPIHNESALVEELFDRYSDLGEIHVYEKQSLENFNIQAQISAYPDLDGDEYRSFVRKLFRDHKGLNVYPRQQEANKDFYDDVVQFVKNHLPAKSIIFIGIFKDDKLFFEVIWGFNDGKANLVTTLDTFHKDDMNEVTMLDIDSITETLQDYYKVPVYSAFIDYHTYEGLFNAWDKESFMRGSILLGKAKYRATEGINQDIIPVFAPGLIDIFRRLTYNI